MGLARSLTAAVIGRPVTLPEDLLHLFPELAEATYRVGGLLPRVGGWPLGLPSVAALTVRRTIFLARGVQLHPELLLHELRHVHQFQASAAFPLRYAWEWLRHGYRDNPFEVDARRWASARVRAALSGASGGDKQP